MPIKGVSFHVGTGGVCFETYLSSIKNARKIFDQASKLGMKMDLLDIGGGYSLCNPIEANSFVQVGAKLNTALDQLFPDKSVRIIAEPGTYMVESSCYLLS
mgnify:CR=1 FL=1